MKCFREFYINLVIMQYSQYKRFSSPAARSSDSSVLALNTVVVVDLWCARRDVTGRVSRSLRREGLTAMHPPPIFCQGRVASMSRFLCWHLFPRSDLSLIFFIFFRFFRIKSCSVVHRSQFFIPVLYNVHSFKISHFIFGSIISTASFLFRPLFICMQIMRLSFFGR